MIEFDDKTHTYRFNGRIIPSVTQIIRETIGAGWQAADWYLERGRAIHACAAFIAQGKDFKFDERLAGYVAALKKFFREVRPSVISSEMMVCSKTYLYGGTIDLFCQIGHKKCIVDYKHSYDPVKLGVQLGGYSEALPEKPDYGFGVEIKECGEYRMSAGYDLRRERNNFLACRAVYALREKCGQLSTQKGEIHE